MKTPLPTIVLMFLASCVAGSKIKSTALLFRHGERTPLMVLSPIVNNAAIEFGPEQLTRVRG